MTKIPTRPKIQDVARVAGVSTATVSRALQNPDMVSPKTRKLVQMAVQQTGYRINSAAQMLRRNRSGAVLVVVPNIRNTFFSEILAGIENIAAETGYTVLIGDSEGEPERCATLLDFLKSGRADGALLLNGMLPEGFEINDNSPIVTVSEAIPDSGLTHVGTDNRAAADCAVSHLIDLGHRQIVHLAGPSGNVLTHARIAGYQDAMTRHALSGNTHVISGNFTIESGLAAADQLTAMPTPPTAVFCANDEMAMGLIFRAMEIGRDVPDDLSVIGFDDIHFSATFRPPLTTIQQPRFAIGQTAMTQLNSLMNGSGDKSRTTFLDYSLVVRDSSKSTAQGYAPT